jgi:hypothetical protein
LISWATPAASWPIEAIFSDCSNWLCACFDPGQQSGQLLVVSGQPGIGRIELGRACRHPILQRQIGGRQIAVLLRKHPVQPLHCLQQGRCRALAAIGLDLVRGGRRHTLADTDDLPRHGLILAEDVVGKPCGQEAVQVLGRMFHAGAGLPHRHHLLGKTAVMLPVQFDMARIEATCDHHPFFVGKMKTRVVGQPLEQGLGLTLVQRLAADHAVADLIDDVHQLPMLAIDAFDAGGEPVRPDKGFNHGMEPGSPQTDCTT